MRMSDWSSDVCSSDLIEAKVSILIHRDLALRLIDTMTPQQSLSPCKALIVHDAGKQIGRASCRERVCQLRVDLGGGRIIKKKTSCRNYDTNSTRRADRHRQ